MIKKVLLVGCKGQLGTEIQRQLESGMSELGPIPVTYRGAEVIGMDVPQIDITDRGATLDCLRTIIPDIVINCAAYTNVDGCESHEDDAYRVNALGVRNLAMAAEHVGSRLMHVSTDYVFSGDGTQPYREYDLPRPVSVYGKTKLAGERFLESFCSRWFTVRSAWLFGHYGKNFVKSILNKAKETGKLTVVDDQRGNPTNAADLAYHMLKIAATEEYGIYHCTGGGECSWYDFAREIVRLSGIEATVAPCSSDAYPSSTKRPAYSSLDHMMLRLSVGDEMRPWQEALEHYMVHREEHHTV